MKVHPLLFPHSGETSGRLDDILRGQCHGVTICPKPLGFVFCFSSTGDKVSHTHMLGTAERVLCQCHTNAITPAAWRHSATQYRHAHTLYSRHHSQSTHCRDVHMAPAVTAPHPTHPHLNAPHGPGPGPGPQHSARPLSLRPGETPQPHQADICTPCRQSHGHNVTQPRRHTPLRALQSQPRAQLHSRSRGPDWVTPTVTPTPPRTHYDAWLQVHKRTYTLETSGHGTPNALVKGTPIMTHPQSAPACAHKPEALDTPRLRPRPRPGLPDPLTFCGPLVRGGVKDFATTSRET